ncbi:CDP-alcohol phosphatidyltransferase family protein [Rhodococcus ruber]|nr:CDP-alcohol phosphatidyltransferase family protein [Rhodococcus ruber]
MDDPDSRAATNRLLAGLRAGRWRPSAWARFLARACQRSARQAQLRPRAFTEATLLHCVLLTTAPRSGRRWIATSWALSVTHLGMLGPRRSLGAPNVLTLVRANLPASGRRLGRWVGVVALATDLLDGHLARATDSTTSFGAAADSLADAAFWTWYSLHQEPRTGLRVAALTVWAAPVVAVTAASMRQGRIIDPPRPAVIRPAAAMQAIITLRALRRR